MIPHHPLIYRSFIGTLTGTPLLVPLLVPPIFKVSERKVTMPQLAKALDEGRVIECFGAGTAAVVSPIAKIGYNGKDYTVPLDPTKPEHPAGALTQRVWDSIVGIQYGKIEHEWSVKI